jgi:hypothetical protein
LIGVAPEHGDPPSLQLAKVADPIIKDWVPVNDLTANISEEVRALE